MSPVYKHFFILTSWKAVSSNKLTEKLVRPCYLVQVFCARSKPELEDSLLLKAEKTQGHHNIYNVISFYIYLTQKY